MISLNSAKWPILIGALVLTSLVACVDEPTTLGSGIVGNDPFTSNMVEFEVFAFNKKIEAVQTNRLPINQLGVYNDFLYGTTEASITSQILLSQTNPVFGTFSQTVEDNPDPESALQDLMGMGENETVTEVFLYIPYSTRTDQGIDSDNDGVVDIFDAEPTDPTNDDDGDSVSNIQETANGTNPLDGDSFEVSDENPANTFPNRVDLDSIYGNRDEPFNLKVEQSTFFLRDLDPNTSFQESQEYFSTQEFSPSFVSDVLFDGDVTISDEEILQFFAEDDPDTDEDETLQVETRLAPGIRVPLSNAFFQENLLDLEGESMLLTQNNFTEFLRGIHLSVAPIMSDEILLLLDLQQANITVNYEYNAVDTNGTGTDTSDDEIIIEEASFVLNMVQPFSGNAVNTLISEAYPPQIQSQLNTGENASRIYLKGGAGAFTEIRLFDNDGDDFAEAINEIKANNLIINEANLIFYVDRMTLDNAGMAPTGEDEPSREPERLYLYSTSTFIPFTFDPENGTVQNDATGKAERYSVNITDHINNIVLRDSANVSLGLTITPNVLLTGIANAMVRDDTGQVVERFLPRGSSLTPTGTVLFGSGEDVTDETKKLKLQIFFTEAN